MNRSSKHLRLIILALIGLAVHTVAGSSVTRPAAHESPAAHYTALQSRIGSGWNTWNNASLLSHVRLPEALAVSLAVKSSHRGDSLLRHAFKASKQANRPESVKTGLRSDDGFYTELDITWKKASFTVQSAEVGDDLLLLVTAHKTDPDYTHNLIIESGMLWGREGKVWRDGDVIRSEVGGHARTLRCTNPLIDEPYLPDPITYLATPLKGEIGIFTGSPRTVAEIKALMAERRRTIEQRHAARGPDAEVFAAMQTVLAWNVIYDAGNRRVIAPVSRYWSHQRAQSYILYCWDTYFSATMFAEFNRDLAYANAVEMTRARSVRGFVPNGAGSYNYRSDDRSQPPVGSLTINSLHKKFGDRWLLELTYDDLLTWNRWWPKERVEQNYLCWGSNKVQPPLGRVMAMANKHAANCESGLDNSPMFDDALYDATSGLLRQADVGLMSFYVRDCLELAEIANTLGRDADERELRDRARHWGARLQTLWNEQAGIFLNRRLDTGEPNPRISPTNLYPLLACVATQAQAERMMRDHYFNPAVFHGEYVIPSCPRNDPAFKEQEYWRGRIWAPMNYLVYLGLREYDLPEARKDLVERSRALLLKGWRENGVIGENYNAMDGGYSDKSNCDNFYHWGALLGYIGLLETAHPPTPFKK